MPGNVALWWQSRQSGIVFWIRLSVGSELTWCTSSGTSERPQSAQRAAVGGEHPGPKSDVGASARATGPVLGAVGVIGQRAAAKARPQHYSQPTSRVGAGRFSTRSRAIASATTASILSDLAALSSRHPRRP